MKTEHFINTHSFQRINSMPNNNAAHILHQAWDEDKDRETQYHNDKVGK